MEAIAGCKGGPHQAVAGLEPEIATRNFNDSRVELNSLRRRMG